MTTPSYSPDRVATPANAVTLTRLLLTPVLWFLIITRGEGGDWLTLAFGTVIAWSDGLDGYLARRHGATRSGAFLDPLADKFLVVGSLIALYVLGRFALLPVALIAAREVIISVFRSYYGRKGLAVPARYWAKIKTIVQQVALLFVMFPPTADLVIADIVLWAAVALTVVTGVQYLFDGSRATTTAGS